MLSVDIKVGTRLNAHVGIVHGGVISLLFDTSLGYAPIAYLEVPIIIIESMLPLLQT